MTNKPNEVRVPRELLEITTSFIKSHAESFANLNHGKRSEAFDTLATELLALLAQPADQQGDPVAWRGCNADGEVVTDWIDGSPPRRMVDLCGNQDAFDKIELAYAQPATAKVVLPERMKARPFQTVDRGSPSYVSAWNACLDEVAKLNGGQS